MPSSLPAPDFPPHHSTTARPSDYAAALAATEHLTADRANAPFASGAPQSEGSNGKKPRVSKTKPSSKHLSKSPSIPLLSGLVMSDAESADKKRNKLGYQRISIACAHCRRRKIRCLVAEDDPENRCQNCIRLKKECVFYPVDQQAAIDAGSEASSKAGIPSGPSSTVSSSPTPLATRQLNTQGQPFGGSFHSATAESPGGFQGIPIPPGGNIPSQGNGKAASEKATRSDHLAGGYAPQEYSYSHRDSPSWNPQEFGTHPQAAPVVTAGSMPPPFTRYGSMAGDTAPFPGSLDQQPQNARQADSMQYPPEHLHQAWQQQQQQAHQPVRSMSYPNYPSQNAYNPVYPINQAAPGSYVRHPYPQPQQYDARMGNMAPHPGPIDGAHPQQYMIPHDQRGGSMSVMPGYPPQPIVPGNWYTDPSSFGQPGEEETREGGYSGHPGRHG